MYHEARNQCHSDILTGISGMEIGISNFQLNREVSSAVKGSPTLPGAQAGSLVVQDHYSHLPVCSHYTFLCAPPPGGVEHTQIICCFKTNPEIKLFSPYPWPANYTPCFHLSASVHAHLYTQWDPAQYLPTPQDLIYPSEYCV